MKPFRFDEVAVDCLTLRSPLPFEFRRQSRAGKIRERVGFEITHVCDRLVFIDRAKTGKGEMPPRPILLFPIERCFPMLLVHRHPAERKPKFRTVISDCFDETQIFAAGNWPRAERKTWNERAMAWSFIVVGKIVTVMADGCNRFLEIDKCHRGRWFTFFLGAFSKNRMQRILREDMFDICNEQLLMLLFVMNPECDDRAKFVQQFLRSGSDKVFNLPINAFAVAE